MEIYVKQLPVHASEKEIKHFFRPYLAEFNITTYDVSKFPGKPLANITILDVASGHRFLQKYGPANRPTLKMNGMFIRCQLSNRAPTDIQLRTLKTEATRQHDKRNQPQQQQQQHHIAPSLVRAADGSATTFKTSSLSCGIWTYTDDRLTYQPHFTDERSGRIVFGMHQAVMLLHPNSRSADRVDINYYNIDSVLTGDYRSPTVTFTLYHAPKFYRQDDESLRPNDTLMDMMAQLGLLSEPMLPKQQQQQPKRLRLPSIDDTHRMAAGICFVYQICLADWHQLASVHNFVSRNRHIESAMQFSTQSSMPASPLHNSMTRLNYELTTQEKLGSLPFGLRFQCLRLAQNGKLSPNQTRALLPCVNRLYREFGETPIVEAVRRLHNHLIPAGPHTEASEYSQPILARLLEDFAKSYIRFGSEDAYSLANRHDHIVLIHRLTVTPAGVYLEGPTAEVTNRVLRDYPGHSNFFLRVCFTDEDGESVRYDPHASQELIYHQRFKSFMDGSYIIAGQGFSFLGFSHSSLRSQTCWFMSPFVFHNEIMVAPMVIRRLGDFSAIRSPARCAARIGQAFTDTTGTVEVDAVTLNRVADVTRNNRVFSDGVGTISESLLKKIWRVYGIRRLLKPTILQIRFAGAKGVVSLDARIQGDQLNIRPSMEKFKGSTSTNVEICGAAFRPLPMILNRGYIKILEDLGVPIQVFMDLQTTAIAQLRMMTSSTINASLLMRESATSKAAQLPTLLEQISDIGLDYRSDPFLRDVLEMVVLANLRDMKYRGRIPVKNGVTLYGIMDETGYLQEDEIYVAVERSPRGGKEVLTGGRVIVTRSPALHPGDIRVVKAVDIPDDSPLGHLSNCVVFSQHGSRDLPSQLSGGDLDGDLYNVIFEPKLMPRRNIAEPADYPRVAPIELDREVTGKDMSDFFVKFMETDQLGQISTVHVQLADQKPTGVFDPDCIKLAGMASTAVDFSKTGIPVDMKECPRRDRNRPDFMAPSPRAIIEAGGLNVLKEEDDDEDLENDPVAELNPETRRIRYYESEKALGHLYRAIDEHKFLRELHNNRRLLMDSHYNDLMPVLWDYVKRNNILLEWEHNRQLARQIKEAYETKLIDILYQYAPSPHHPLTESELFAGTILGRAAGASSRRLREMTITMRERFDEILTFTISRIVNGDADGEDRNDEALPRAMACFAVGMEEVSLSDRKIGGPMKSWKYVAAGVCLREMKRWMTGGPGYGMLPRA